MRLSVAGEELGLMFPSTFTHTFFFYSYAAIERIYGCA